MPRARKTKPDVSELSPLQIQMLRHMLGATEHVQRSNWGYRNHYAAGTAAVPDLEQLTALGYCTRGVAYRQAHVYHATVKGCKAAGLNKAAIARAFES